MKKSILYITVGLLASLMLGGCINPDYVETTATRQGITSLKAYFTSGTYKDVEAANYIITNDSTMTDYVIPIPWYYPEETDNLTTDYLSSMKVVATIANNCSINPAITVLNLNEKTPFVFTNPDGSTREITISGQRVHSNACAIKSLTAKAPGIDDVSGVIDEDSKTITLVSFDDLSACTVDLTLSPHATVKDPQTTYNFNTGAKITITADDGITTATYTVMKGVVNKIENGIRKGSQTQLFLKDIADPNGLAVTNADAVHPSLAVVGNFLVVDLGNGSTPTYMKKSTGTIMGKIALGVADASGCITSDLNSNMLICNYAESGSTLNIYKTNSVTQAPQLYISYKNNMNVSVGSRLHIQGSLDGDAVIEATCENSNNVLRWIVKNGTVGAPENITISGVSSWGGYDNIASVVSRENNATGGYFVSHYDGGNDNVYYCSGTTNSSTTYLSAQSDGNGWGYNYAPIDTRDFNNMKYLVLYTQGYWPDWGLPAQLYLYDVTSLSSFTGTADGSKALVYSENIYNNVETGGFTTIGYADDGRFGNVIMAPSKDGYKLDIYYIDNTSLGVGGIEFDCIDK